MPNRCTITPECAETLRSRAKAGSTEIGLLIILTTSSTDSHVVASVPCPLQDGSLPLSIKSEKTGSGTKLVIEQNWITEHADQVMDLCPGGLQIGGLYIICSSSVSVKSSSQLVQALEAVSKTGRADEGPAAQRKALPPPPALLLTAQHGADIAAYVSDPKGSSKSLKSCSLSSPSDADKLVQLQCRYQVNARQSIGSSSTTYIAALEQLAAQESKRIQAGIGCFADTPAHANTPLSSLSNSSAIEVKLLTAPPSACAGSEGGQPPRGQIHLQGCLTGISCTLASTSSTDAMQLLKDDLVGSLRARIDSLAADAEEGQNAALLDALPAAGKLTTELPLRISIPVQGNIVLTDHISTKEARAAGGLLSAANEVLGLQLVSNAQVTQLETDVSKAGIAALPSESAAIPRRHKGGVGLVGVVLAVFAALLAAAWVIAQRGS